MTQPCSAAPHRSLDLPCQTHWLRPPHPCSVYPPATPVTLSWSLKLEGLNPQASKSKGLGPKPGSVRLSPWDPSRLTSLPSPRPHFPTCEIGVGPCLSELTQVASCAIPAIVSCCLGPRASQAGWICVLCICCRWLSWETPRGSLWHPNTRDPKGLPAPCSFRRPELQPGLSHQPASKGGTGAGKRPKHVLVLIYMSLYFLNLLQQEGKTKFKGNNLSSPQNPSWGPLNGSSCQGLFQQEGPSEEE